MKCECLDFLSHNEKCNGAADRNAPGGHSPPVVKSTQKSSLQAGGGCQHHLAAGVQAGDVTGRVSALSLQTEKQCEGRGLVAVSE